MMRNSFTLEAETLSKLVGHFVPKVFSPFPNPWRPSPAAPFPDPWQQDIGTSVEKLVSDVRMLHRQIKVMIPADKQEFAFAESAKFIADTVDQWCPVPRPIPWPMPMPNPHVVDILSRGALLQELVSRVPDSRMKDQLQEGVNRLFAIALDTLAERNDNVAGREAADPAQGERMTA